MTNLEHAQNYAVRGWRVLPLHWIKEDGSCSCGKRSCESPGKHPIAQLAKFGSRSASNNVATVGDWWGVMPKANVGIATGKESGLVVLDVDPRHGGSESIKWLIEEHGDFTQTLAVKTGSGGLHYYYRHPGFDVSNSAGALSEGIDVRGEGGYVVAPPSNHASGGSYGWAFDDSERGVAAMPGWIASKGNNEMPVVATRIPDMIAHGTQHHALVSLAGTMRRRGMGAEEIYAALTVTNRTRCERPGPEANIRRIAESVCQYEPEEIIGAVTDIEKMLSAEGEPLVVSLADSIAEALERTREAKALGGRMPGLSFGFERIDKMTNGAKPGELIVVAARPSMGKTALSVQLSETFARQKPGLIFSVEMARLAVTDRFLSADSHIDSQRLASGHISDDEMAVLERTASRLSELPVGINDDGSMTTRLMAQIIENEGNVGWVVVDYLQMLRAEGRDNREQEVASISRDLKAIAKRFNIPVIAPTQLSRKNEARTDKRPQLSDLRESGQIEQDADIVMFIHRPERYGEEHVEVGGRYIPADGMALLMIAKQRNGPVGDVALAFEDTIARFSDYDYLRGVVKKETKGISYSYTKPQEVPF